jgi:propionate CoA-transferase
MSVPVESPSSTSVRDKVITTERVVLPAESLSGGTEVRDKVVTATEAVRLIRHGDSVVVEGFVGQCFAEELTLALEQRFLLTGTPKT